MHNNIMAAGSRDHPPMLAMGRYAQWQSRFMRYVDIKPNDDASPHLSCLLKCRPLLNLYPNLQGLPKYA
ncbi:hypothetical protein Tco_0734498 [Tanacetum coccineum]